MHSGARNHRPFPQGSRRFYGSRISLVGAWLAALLPLMAYAAAGEVRTSKSPSSKPPNIVFIFTDDHSVASISAYGSRINKTPSLDRMAREGMIFDRCFCTNGICAPSRAVILTGLHSHLNGVRDNRDSFDGSQTTFPRLLQGAGYQTALIGKWHLKSDPTGFDHWEVLPGQGSYYNPDLRTAQGQKRYEGYATDVVTDLAMEWLENRGNDDQPFLLMCQHKAPHRTWMPGPKHLDLFREETIPEPATLFDDYGTRCDAARNQEMEIDRHMYMYYDLQVPPDDPDAALEGPDRYAASILGRMSPSQRKTFEDAFAAENAAFKDAGLEGQALVRWKYQRYIKNYLRCIASVDENVGRLLDFLDQSGMSKDTLVVYSSDQGFFLGEHGWYDKRFMYEPSLRMPLIVRWPSVIEPGTRASELIQNLDFAPTFLDVAGAEIPDSMQGMSFLKRLQGENVPWRKSIYYEYFEKDVHAVAPHYGVRTERYKLIHFPGIKPLNGSVDSDFWGDGAWELYDLAQDADEVTNLHGHSDHEETARRLHEELRRLRKHYRVPGS